MSEQLSVFLSPGDTFVGDAHYRVTTLLGSCVSITLWQPERRVGAMSHFLLARRGPTRKAAATRPAAPLDGRYGDEALAMMLQGLAALGVSPHECEAKLFGGGDMFPGHTTVEAHRVGRRNGDAARAMLRAHGIRIVSFSLFGEGHRKIIFDIATGDVWARQAAADALLPAGIVTPRDRPAATELAGLEPCVTSRRGVL